MSDTTPRPDETTSDAAAPPQDQTPPSPRVEQTAPSSQAPPPPPPPAAPPAADVEATEVVPSPEEVAAAQPSYDAAGGAQFGQPLPPPPPPPYPAPVGQEVVPNPMKPSDERTTGMAAHLVAGGATILSSGFLGFVCALVMYLVFRDRGPFVRAHAANALNIQIIAGIVMLVSLPLMLVLVGFLTFGAAVVWAIIMHIIGAVKANNGEWWDPPMTPQFVK